MLRKLFCNSHASDATLARTRPTSCSIGSCWPIRALICPTVRQCVASVPLAEASNTKAFFLHMWKWRAFGPQSHNFLYDSTSIVFSVDFDKVSLVDLVADPEARGSSRKPTSPLKPVITEPLWSSSRGVHSHATGTGSSQSLIATAKHAVSLWAKAKRNSFSSFALSDIENALGLSVASSLRRILEGNDSSIETISEAIELGNAGIDLNEYMLFAAYTPVVHQFIGGNLRVEWMKDPTDDAEVVSRCLDFVVTAAVRYGA